MAAGEGWSSTGKGWSRSGSSFGKGERWLLFEQEKGGQILNRSAAERYSQVLVEKRKRKKGRSQKGR